MKLFYSEGSCSLSPHIVLNELGIPFEKIKIDWTGNDGTLKELNRLNENGCVPTLQLEDGSALTEGAAIVQYLADLKP
ncbi:MAG: glutathione transferase GstA, partial [Proteobacteria bacterium]